MQIRQPVHQAARAIEATCPHGAMPGACPACGGGGGGGGPARKNSGLMTWNEAYALWKSIQTGQARQTDYLKGLNFQQQARSQKAAADDFRQMLAMALARTLQAASALLSRPMLTTLIQAFSVPGRAFAQALPAWQNGLHFIMRFMVQQTAGFLKPFVDITDKLATILGDAKKLLDDLIHHNAEVFKRLRIRLGVLAQQMSVSGLFDKILKQFLNGETPQAERSGSLRMLLRKLGRKLRHRLQHETDEALSAKQSTAG